MEKSELRNIAERIRNNTWELSERWSRLNAENHRPNLYVGGEQLSRFGEIPAFLAALAHHLDELADTKDDDSTPPLLSTDFDLRRAAIEHAKTRADAGYDQRDMLAEFVTLRRVLWEHFASTEAAERPTFEGERIINLLLDNVIVEAADQFFAELTEALVRRAERDPLTDLLNRQTFHDKLGRELARAQRFDRKLTLVTIDLDAFKEVNDTLGHLAGDAVLKRLGNLLTTHTREQDLVGRLGGDEFSVALVEADMSTAIDLIRRLRIHLVSTRRQFGLPRKFGISFGAASYPDDGETVEQLLFHSDAKMYEQKGAGRGQRMHEVGHTPQLKKLRILVADDDPSIRTLCRETLEVEGFEVAEASNGEDAVEQVLSEAPDLVLLDVSMPKMDGWAVLNELNERESTQHIPVLMITGRAHQENLDRADRAGVLGFISKPFDPQRLIANIHDVLELADRRRAMRETTV